ncbi:hypothetical protein FOCC_FOCC000673 [Frankliniella occidentalis]|nr:hypothetical protein FOCC_FOCC000673 [Frankliniella occidentalis]
MSEQQQAHPGVNDTHAYQHSSDSSLLALSCAAFAFREIIAVDLVLTHACLRIRRAAFSQH